MKLCTAVGGVLVVTMLCALSPPLARATLITADYVMPGDGLLTFDTLSGLEWLDVTLTVNQTYDQVRLGPYYADGFYHATKEELQTLFIHAGTPDDGFDISQTYPAETKALARLLGVTLLTDGGERTLGFTGTDFSGNTVTLANHPIGTPFSALLGKIDYINLPPPIGEIGEANFAGGHPFSNQADAIYGSFLIRAVPEPGTMGFLLVGLGSLAAGISRRF